MEIWSACKCVTIPLRYRFKYSARVATSQVHVISFEEKVPIGLALALTILLPCKCLSAKLDLRFLTGRHTNAHGRPIICTILSESVLRMFLTYVNAQLGHPD